MSDRAGRILVVDDEPGMREGCRRILVSEGHRVTVAESGEQALGISEKGAFDAALLDLKMPGMSGLELLEGVPAIEADREEMRRLFTNLVDNAIKYNREGGAVRVAVGARLAGQQTDGFVAVEVSDTGIGIPRGAIARLGEAFYRVRTADTLQITGTGLGLSICKQIIEAHNGHLEIESEEGKGSTFRVLLPRSGAGAVQ